MATYHPSALLRIPDEAAREEARRQFLADLGKVAERLHLD
jgi:DNA polymerase